MTRTVRLLIFPDVKNVKYFAGNQRFGHVQISKKKITLASPENTGVLAHLNTNMPK